MSYTESYIRKARVLLEQRRPLEAEKQLSQALQSEPSNHQALSLLARCKYDLKLYRDGINIVLSAISISPQEDYYYYLLAFGHYQISGNQQAQNAIHQAISINPFAADYFGLMALINLDAKQFQRALDIANEGLELDPENITCLNARSTALNKLKRTDDAIQTMYTALDMDPENDYTHTNIGWNFLEKGRHKEASQHFTEALRLNPNLENARIGLKESLKSKILPYKWILQYSFWINNQGKKARWIIPVALYIIVRIIAGVSNAAGGMWTTTGLIVVALYILFVFTTWVINPLANFMLLFSRKGRYAVTLREKWNSILLIVCLIAAVGFFIFSFFIPVAENQISPYLIAAIITLTISIPLGNMDFPVKPKGNSALQWYSILLVGIGISALALTFINWETAVTGLIIYGIGFMAYTWWSLFSSR